MQNESRIERSFCDKIKKDKRFIVIKCDGISYRGFPDRLVIGPGGRILFVEFKDPRGKLSIYQIKCIQKLIDIGHDVLVATSSDEAIQYVRKKWNEECDC